MLSACAADDEAELDEDALLGLGDLGDDPMLLDDDLAHPMTPIAEEPGAANDDPPLEDAERHTLNDDDEGASSFSRMSAALTEWQRIWARCW